MKRVWILILTIALLLGGCSWMDGNFVSIQPHQDSGRGNQDGVVYASGYLQLRRALEDMVRSGRENGVIHVSDFDQDQVSRSMDMAVRYVMDSFPIGAYAVEEIQYEVGTGGGKPAIAVEISYLRSYVEIRKIHTVRNMREARNLISQTLESHDAGVVLLVESYEPLDIAQFVATFTLENPDQVMELPQVAVGIYPDSGNSRVIELQLTYQNSRDALRQMKAQVSPLFTSAEMYVTSDAQEHTKYSQLYTFLMERFDYQLDTSITPAYSLLRHGVGDSKAFATVYAAMCRRVGLECQVVTGTRDGEPWSWNIIQDRGRWFHVDLLRGNKAQGFREYLDGEMSGYVWDYSAYPVCDTAHPLPEETQPATGPEDAEKTP